MAGNKTRSYLPVRPSDYPVQSAKYSAFERAVTAPMGQWVQPNHLTYFRFLIGLVLLGLGARFSYLSILLLTALGGLSDFFDGALARSRGKKTSSGIILDPFADKLLVAAVFYLLVGRGDVPRLFFLLMLGFEAHMLLIPAMAGVYHLYEARTHRPHRLSLGEKVRIQPAFPGRLKLHLYVSSISLILLGRAAGAPPAVRVGQWLLRVGLVVASVALVNYVVKWRSMVRERAGQGDLSGPLQTDGEQERIFWEV